MKYKTLWALTWSGSNAAFPTLEEQMNNLANDGWRLHSWRYIPDAGFYAVMALHK